MSNQLKFEIIGESESGQAAFRKLSTAAEDTHGHLGKLRTIMAGVFAGNLLTEGASKAVEFFKSSVDAAVEDQRAEAMLTQTLHNSADATDAQTEAVKRRLLADGEHLGIMQDQMMPAFQKLVMVTHSTTQATGLLTLTENIAAAKHIQLADAASLVAKMQMGSNRVFKEFGVTVISNASAITAVTKAQDALVFVQNEVSSGALTGKKAVTALAAAHLALAKAQFNSREAMKSVREGMQKVADFTKGDAQKAADTYAGRLAQMHVRFHDLQVTVGNAVLPVLTELMGFIMQKAVPALSAMATFVQKNQSWLLPLGAAILGVVAAVKTWAFVQAILDTELEANPIGAVITAIVAFVAAVILAYNKVKWFHDLVNVAFHAIAAVVGFVVDFIKKYWIEMLAFMVGGPFGAAIAYVITHWNQISSAFSGVVGFVKHIWNDLMGWFGGMGAKISSITSGMWNGIGSAFKAAINVAITAWDWLVSKLHIHVPSIGVGPLHTPGFDWNPGSSLYIQPLAQGGIVMPRRGGTLAQLAEAGHPEAVIPLDGKHSFGGSMNVTVNVSGFVGNEQQLGSEITRQIRKQARLLGFSSAAQMLSQG